MSLLLPSHLLTVMGPKESFSHYSRARGQQLPSGPGTKPVYPFVSLSIPLIWGAVLLLGLLVVAVVLFAVMARRKGRWLPAYPSGSVLKMRPQVQACNSSS